MADYFSSISWGTIANNVSSYYNAGTFVLNTYTIDVYPIDINEPGAAGLECDVNDYFIDFLGYPWLVTNIATEGDGLRIRVYDVNERSESELIHYAPYGNRIGYVYKPTRGAFILAQAQLLKLDTQARDRINNIEKGVIWENLRGIINIFDNILAIQQDNTLDPSATPSFGDRYIILDSTDLHLNFGTIVGLEDDDIVEFNGDEFVIFWDASLATSSITVTVALDINAAVDKLWYYSTSTSLWADKEAAINYWTKNVLDLQYTAGNIKLGSTTNTIYDSRIPRLYVQLDSNSTSVSNYSAAPSTFVVANMSTTNNVMARLGFVGSNVSTTKIESAFIAAVFKSHAANGISTDLVFGTSDESIEIGGFEKMRLDYRGYLGIGINPSYNLDVNGTTRISGAITLNSIAYTFPSSDGTNDYVLTTNGSGTLSWSQKTGGTSGTITSLNGSSESAQTLTSGTGLTVTDSGTGNYIHTISVTSGYSIPTTSELSSFNSHLINYSNPHSVTHTQTSPSLIGSGITYGHLNDGAQRVYGFKGFGLTPTYQVEVRDDIVVRPTTHGTGLRAKIGFGPGETRTDQPAAFMGMLNDGVFWYNGTGLSFYTTAGPDSTANSPVERLRISSSGVISIATTPATDLSSSPVLVRDASTGEIKQTTISAGSNNYPTALTFNTSDGIITLARNGLSSLTTVSLDGRYLTGTKVDSFNTRTGAVTLSSSDVTSALTYTPVRTVSAGNGISVSGTTDSTITLATPGTSTNATSNQVTTNSHTHAISGFALSSHIHVTSEITDITTAATGITKVGTINTGIWNGTAIADSYISSAATWNGKQTAYTNLTTIGALTNANGFLRQNGAGVFSYDTNVYYLNSNPSNYTANTGTVTSVSAGSGMSFTTITGAGSVAMGQPGTCSLSTSNQAAGTSHTHALSLTIPSKPNELIDTFDALTASGGIFTWASSNENVLITPTTTNNTINITGATNGMSGMAYLTPSSSSSLVLQNGGSGAGVKIDSNANLVLVSSSFYMLTWTCVGSFILCNLAEYVSQ